MKSISELLIAHRGESYDAPENTLASLNLAWERGALAVEVDVHLSKDNQVVVIHDSTTTRTAGKSEKVKNQAQQRFRKKWKVLSISRNTPIPKTGKGLQALL